MTLKEWKQNDNYNDKRVLQEIPQMPYRVPEVNWRDVKIKESLVDGNFRKQALKAMEAEKDRAQGYLF